MRKPVPFLLLFCLFIPGLYLHATETPGEIVNLQGNHYLTVSKIKITGNKITRQAIILREIPFSPGDSIAMKDLPLVLGRIRENLINTSLFNFATADTVTELTDHQRVILLIHVVERWYIWPFPFFELSDRNVNAWLQAMDFSRLSYGIDLTIYNARGRNETLQLPIHLGFNEMVGMTYRVPYLNRKQTLGIKIGGVFLRNHEVSYVTERNKLRYLRDYHDYPFQGLYVFTEVIQRYRIYNSLLFRLSYQYDDFSDSLLKINPFYSTDSRKNMSFFSVGFQYKSDHRDAHYYPLKGYYFDLILEKDGLSLLHHETTNIFSLNCNLRKYWQLYPRWYFSAGGTLKFSTPPEQPYFLQKGLGYGREFIRGYEYYVIDGQHYAFIKTNVKFALLPERNMHLGFLKSGKFNPLHYAFYVNLFGDAGYVIDNNTITRYSNTLARDLLVGYGIGLDFATYYDIVCRFELSVNKMNEAGLFIHFIAPL